MPFPNIQIMSFFKRVSKHSAHPNKHVQRHEAYLINKSLKKKVKRVKSTLQNTNKFYSEKIRSKKISLLFKCYLERKKK